MEKKRVADEFFYMLCCSSRKQPEEKEIEINSVGEISVDIPKRIKPAVQYKLRYFDIRGLGEPLRMIFHYSRVPFEDIRITQEEWPSLKSATRIGKLPELEVNGAKLSQSMAIARFLWKKFEFDSDVDDDAVAWKLAKIDEVADTQKDLTNELAIYIGTALGMRDGKKNVLKKKVYLPTINRYFFFYVRLLEESRSGFLIEHGPTWIDFFVEEYLTTLCNIDGTALKEYPELARFMNRVRTLPQLKDYIESRKETIV